MNYIYSFIIFEAGAFFGFFVAALLNAARAGQEITIKFEEEDNGAERSASYEKKRENHCSVRTTEP